jgi:lambda family phage portal protein
VATPWGALFGQQVDGIELDAIGNPLAYYVLADHPGDSSTLGLLQYSTVGAERMIHLYREDRPGQRRGIPEVTPALPLFAILRRYTLATLQKAEVAALMALFLKTNASGMDPADLGDPFQVLDFERNAMTTLPDGWSIEQLKAESPTDAHDAFVTSIMREIARCLDIPRSIAMGDSTGLNYSSGRLDHQTYFRSIEIDRFDFQVRCLDRIFREWLNEAALVPGFIPDGLPLVAEWDHEWQWDGFEHVDPLKEAKANETRIRVGMASIPDLCAKEGVDYESMHRKAAASLGMSVEEYRQRLADSLFGPVAPEPSPDAQEIAEEVANAA